MRLDHQFSVPAKVDVVWQALLDPERVAPCMPGATLSEVDGDSFTGSVKVKLGPISLLYKGKGEFQEKDESAKKVVIKASGKDSRGGGTASATVTVTLAEDGDNTTGTVATDLSITGRPAQFGRGMISEVGGKILDSFATCLADKLGGTSANQRNEEPAPGKPVDAVDSAPRSISPVRQETAPIDLVDYAGASVAKRAVPLVLALAALIGVVLTIRSRRGYQGDRK